MNRRGFMGSILALGAAPAIVRADSLMRIIAPETLVEEVPFELDFTAQELTLSMDEFSRLYIIPTMRVLVSGIESDILRGLGHSKNKGDLLTIRMPNRYKVVA